MRLLNHLLSTGQIERTDVDFYLAYTTKISVLNFDYSYRELQAEHAFRWGTFSPHMELQILLPKRPRTVTQHTLSYPSKQPWNDCRILKAKGSFPFGPKCGTVTRKPGHPLTSQKTINTIYEPYLRSMGAEFTCELFDREFILNGIKPGFNIVDPEKISKNVEVNNYLSATNADARARCESQILTEIANGHYEVVDKRPCIISALGAIPKKGSSKVSLIHDCSRPSGAALNDYATTVSKLVE
ncbi:hypothetical protein DPMN_093620 [Dreissena polymorpha]|uniref:Uncharacterized protein n=1 Tax=Dreissena polymorpha TaxID=45954 RepID=A0A9D4L4E0_DREPO|nr:hypothetical protein DPMN_093620 [Dreissena polymorpha]